MPAPVPRAPMPRPVTIRSLTPFVPCFSLMSAVASPLGVAEGCTTPSCVAVPVGLMLGTIASAGRSGPLTGGAVVVVVVSSFGLWSFSALAAVVVVGAGAAGVPVWLAGLAVAGTVEGVAAGGAVGAVGAPRRARPRGLRGGGVVGRARGDPIP